MTHLQRSKIKNAGFIRLMFCVLMAFVAISSVAQKPMWKKGYFTDEFGDPVLTAPFYIIELPASYEGILVRVSHQGIEFQESGYSIGGFDSQIKIKDQYGSVYNFPYTKSINKTFLVNDYDSFKKIVNIFYEGHFSISIIHHSFDGSSIMSSRTAKVGNLTRNIYDVLNYLGIQL